MSFHNVIFFHKLAKHLHASRVHKKRLVLIYFQCMQRLRFLFKASSERGSSKTISRFSLCKQLFHRGDCYRSNSFTLLFSPVLFFNQPAKRLIKIYFDLSFFICLLISKCIWFNNV